MDEAEKKKIIEKYKKLLALTKSPFPEEADTAKLMAEKFREKFNIRKIETDKCLNGYWEYSPAYWYDEHGQKQHQWKRWHKPKEYRDYYKADNVNRKSQEYYDELHKKAREEAIENLKESGFADTIDDWY